MANSSYSLDLPLRHYRCQVGDQVACRPNMATETIKCSEGETLVSLFSRLFISVTCWECLQLENTPTTWWPNLGSCLNQRYVSYFPLISVILFSSVLTSGPIFAIELTIHRHFLSNLKVFQLMLPVKILTFKLQRSLLPQWLKSLSWYKTLIQNIHL